MPSHVLLAVGGAAETTKNMDTTENTNEVAATKQLRKELDEVLQSTLGDADKMAKLKSELGLES